MWMQTFAADLSKSLQESHLNAEALLARGRNR